MPIYGFDEDSAKRIGQTVRLVEGKLVAPRSSSGSKGHRGSSGVRCMLGTISTAAWSKESSSTITVYSGEPGSEVTAGTVAAYNYFADISTSTNTARWVSVSNNGYGWLLIAAECD